MFFKELPADRFSKDVCMLFVRGNISKSNLVFQNAFSNKMMLGLDVFGSCMEDRIES